MIFDSTCLYYLFYTSFGIFTPWLAFSLTHWHAHPPLQIWEEFTIPLSVLDGRWLLDTGLWSSISARPRYHRNDNLVCVLLSILTCLWYAWYPGSRLSLIVERSCGHQVSTGLSELLFWITTTVRWQQWLFRHVGLFFSIFAPEPYVLISTYLSIQMAVTISSDMSRSVVWCTSHRLLSDDTWHSSKDSLLYS